MQEQIIIDILGQLALDNPQIDQNKTRETLRFILDEYNIDAKTKALALNSNMHGFINMYIATRKLDGLSLITLENYARNLRIFSEWVPLNISDVTTMDIRKFLAQYGQERNLKNSSLDTLQTHIRTFFNWLEDEDHIAKSPAKKLKPIKFEKRTRKSLTATQLESLRIDGCKDSRDRALIEMFFSTGGRVSEIAQIDIDKINWIDNSVSVIGKGNKERTIYFTDKAKVYIKRYIADRGIREEQALFITSKIPHARIKSNGIWKIISQIGKRAGFETAVFPHLLRHTMATLGYKAGLDLPTIQRLLGHTDSATTQIYAELDQDSVMQAHKKHMGI